MCSLAKRFIGHHQPIELTTKQQNTDIGPKSVLHLGNDSNYIMSNVQKSFIYIFYNIEEKGKEELCIHFCPCLSFCCSKWIWPLSVWPLKSEKKRDCPGLKGNFSRFTQSENSHTHLYTHVKRVPNKDLYQEFKKEASTPCGAACT